MLWKEFRSARKARRRSVQLPSWIYRLIFYTVPFALWTRGALSCLIAFLLLWTLGSVCLRAHQLLASLYDSPDLHVLNHLPIADEAIFRVQAGQALRRSLWSVADFVVLYGILVSHSGPGFAALVLQGFGFGLAHAGFVIAAGVCLAALRIRSGWLLLAALLFFASAVGLLFAGGQSGTVTNLVSRAADWLPPLNWTLYALGVSPAESYVGLLWVCLELGLLLAALPFAWRRLRRNYVLNEEVFAAARRLIPTPDPIGAPELAEQLSQSPQEVRSAIQKAEFREGLDWSALGWIERLIASWLSPRERLAAEFLTAGSPGWTKGLRATVVLAVIAAAGWRLFFASAALPPFLAILAICFFVVVASGQWPGFSCPQGVGLQSPFYAVYPFSIRDMLRVLLKVNLVRFLLCAPVLFGAVLVAHGALPQGEVDLVSIGLKLLGLGVLFQPAIALWSLAGSIQEGQKNRYQLGAFVLVLLLVGSSVLFLFAPTTSLLAAGAAGTALVSTALVLLYVRLYDRGHFDLLPGLKTSGAGGN